MSRRSLRLVTGGYYPPPEDDGASTSSTGSFNGSQVSYRESPIRIFKKKAGTRRPPSSSSHCPAHQNAYSESLGSYASEEPIKAEEYWGIAPSVRELHRSSRGGSRSKLPPPSADGQGHSSGYSSSEEGGSGSSQVLQVQPGLGFWDLLLSPGKAVAMLFWWLGTAWYSLTTGASMLDVFLLSRHTGTVKKAIELLLLLLLLAFGIWYWYPFLTLSSGGASTVAPLHSSQGSPGIRQDSSVISRLSALEKDMGRMLGERAREGEREKMREGGGGLTPEMTSSLIHMVLSEREASWREERETLQRQITQLKQDGETKWQETQDKLQLASKRLLAEVSELKSTVTGLQTMDDSNTLERLTGLEQQLRILHSDFNTLNTDHHSLREQLHTLDTSHSQVRSELAEWLAQYLSSPPKGAVPVVLRPEMQEALRGLERQVEERLSRAGGGAWASVGETLQGAGIGGVTLQEVHRVVQRALALYRADGIGLADYALESSGASVINTRCSETYETKTALLTLFGIPMWYHSQSPRAVIQPDVHPGSCWAFRGSHGFVVVQLSSPVRPRAVTLEHIPRTLSPSGRIDSAPRHFAVYGMTSEKQEEGTLLGQFTYDQDGEPIQTFTLPDSLQEVYPLVELRVLSNWGHPEYTCVYRFRVHGEGPHL
ncbi:SUN domain-containing protein 2 [Amia ocellicauda]|uniref:SUN domain-containing protein 2 n=1 Tax=Amia ocellicauda TaxID=2972642 RepID=UPI003463EBED